MIRSQTIQLTITVVEKLNEIEFFEMGMLEETLEITMNETVLRYCIEIHILCCSLQDMTKSSLN